tara:strand:- start:684 stop:905 length:222 start_codon:yes stop_codon:yes gene_type:complete
MPTDKPAFYKQTYEPSEYWAAGRTIINKNYELFIEDHASYTYPIDGWNYYVTPPQAYLDWVEANTPPEDDSDE